MRFAAGGSMFSTELQQMATQGEGMGNDRAGAPGGNDAAGPMHGALRHPPHPDDPWYQPESGVPRDEDAYEHPPLSEE
jgi:hypothetical protein